MTQTAFDLDDSTLVDSVEAGDGDAFDTLFRRHYSAVERMCSRRLGDPAAGDEVAQVAFMQAYERIRLGLGDRRFGPWVRGIAFEICLRVPPGRDPGSPEPGAPLAVAAGALASLVDLRRRTDGPRSPVAPR